jgi:hypothetical protein
METSKIFILLITLLLCQSMATKAQDDKLYNTISKSLVLNKKVFYSDDFYNKSVMFSISVGFNKSGTIDTIIYSGTENKLLNRLFDLKELTKGLNANKNNFKSYKNEFVVLMVAMVRGDESFIQIENGNQHLSDWESMIKNSVYIQNTGRRKLLLTPMLIHTRGKIIRTTIQ